MKFLHWMIKLEDSKKNKLDIWLNWIYWLEDQKLIHKCYLISPIFQKSQPKVAHPVTPIIEIAIHKFILIILSIPRCGYQKGIDCYVDVYDYENYQNEIYFWATDLIVWRVV